MLIPVLVGLRGAAVPSALAYEHAARMGHAMPAASDTLLPALAAVGLHAAAMLVVAGGAAVVVCQKLGVEILRTAWINLDFIWVGALAIAGTLALGFGLWSFAAG